MDSLVVCGLGDTTLAINDSFVLSIEIFLEWPGIASAFNELVSYIASWILLCLIIELAVGSKILETVTSECFIVARTAVFWWSVSWTVFAITEVIFSLLRDSPRPDEAYRILPVID